MVLYTYHSEQSQSLRISGLCEELERKEEGEEEAHLVRRNFCLGGDCSKVGGFQVKNLHISIQ